MLAILAHAGEAHEPSLPAAADESWLTAMFHQPMAVSVIVVAASLIVVYQLTKLLRVSPAGRWLSVAAACIGLGLLYMPHQPGFTGVILSGGFILVFMLVFTLLRGDSR